jgi:hypothetical protein
MRSLSSIHLSRRLGHEALSPVRVAGLVMTSIVPHFPHAWPFVPLADTHRIDVRPMSDDWLRWQEEHSWRTGDQ